MRLTPDLKELRELHTLYRKCSITQWPGFHGHGTHLVGLCKGCGKAYIKAKTPHSAGIAGWTEVPRVVAARYIKQQRLLERGQARVLISLQASLDARLGT